MANITGGGTPSCKYNAAVDCMGRDRCFKCGWNPAVDAERKGKIRSREVKINAGKGAR